MNKDQTHMSETLKLLEKMLDNSPIPEMAVRNLKKQIRDLRQLIIENRSPRLALVGRRGSGKSSLINAIFGEEVAKVGHTGSQTGKARWFTYTGKLGHLDILDTRGFQEGSKPDEHDDAASSLESVQKAFRENTPDVLLFLVNAKEADSAIDADLDALSQLSTMIESITGVRPPVIVVMTHCDLIEPKDVSLHDQSAHDPDDVSEKLQKIKEIEEQLDKKILSRPDLKQQLATVIGISSYQSWKADKRRSDQRWNMDELLTLLMDKLPDQCQLEFVRLSQVRGLQVKVATTLTNLISAICGGVATVPIPVADIVPITTLQVGLVTAIAYVSGRTPSVEAVRDLLVDLGANVAGALAFREVARALIKLFPGGSLVSSTIAIVATKSIGKAATAYYIHHSTLQEAASIFKNEKKSS